MSHRPRVRCPYCRRTLDLRAMTRHVREWHQPKEKHSTDKLEIV